MHADSRASEGVELFRSPGWLMKYPLPLRFNASMSLPYSPSPTLVECRFEWIITLASLWGSPLLLKNRDQPRGSGPFDCRTTVKATRHPTMATSVWPALARRQTSRKHRLLEKLCKGSRQLLLPVSYFRERKSVEVGTSFSANRFPLDLSFFFSWLLLKEPARVRDLTVQLFRVRIGHFDGGGGSKGFILEFLRLSFWWHCRIALCVRDTSAARPLAAAARMNSSVD